MDAVADQPDDAIITPFGVSSIDLPPPRLRRRRPRLPTAEDDESTVDLVSPAERQLRAAIEGLAAHVESLVDHHCRNDNDLRVVGHPRRLAGVVRVALDRAEAAVLAVQGVGSVGHVPILRDLALAWIQAGRQGAPLADLARGLRVALDVGRVDHWRTRHESWIVAHRLGVPAVERICEAAARPWR